MYIVNFDTQGLNWKKVLRAHDIFVALVTPAWHRDALAQRQSAVDGVAVRFDVDRGDQTTIEVEARVERGDPIEAAQEQRGNHQQNEG